MQIGVIAGTGDLPKIIAKDARERGIKVITIALENLASSDLSKFSDEIKWINVGKLGEMIDTLKEFDVKEAIMAGKVSKTLLYKSKITPDLRAVKLLFSLKDKSDDSILNAITRELEKEGIHIIDTTAFSPHLLTPEGVLTDDPPTMDEWKDIEFGWKIAKEIGKLDIGQTVVVKDQAVMAVEAIEGTDEAIIRGGKLSGEGAVVVKVSKPHQDMRLDVPVVGLDTLRSMIDIRARVLAVEAQKSMLISRERFAKEAEDAGISVVGISHEKILKKISHGKY
ncbi:MAG: UDP-2,3-diacylglucosamine diphosphatase LpxI [Nitrospirae bacterium]|nr:UDP-2,3-diacylglucosamine diphosphatase LpxI [Nitrospirota bacterium]MCL5062390.1 UDP-2,3-diacylglucosamine diphosphatase LpxI [Nitrospirota bacterium]MDA8215822.1 UDP-2,3-diacylglucosamine diphosphatase LpxI [Nitrospiraceae bacterium]MDA8338511.1 UDP-2,3-diacylglucosamine diphosphatase LpxI [Nitrospiraceae bacterium]